MIKNFLKITAAVAGTAAAATVAGAYYGYHVAFQRDEKRCAEPGSIPAGASYEPFRAEMQCNVEQMLESPFERVSIRSFDGLNLVGKYYEGTPGAPLMIFFHGYRSCAERDGSGSFQLCREMGYHLLAVEQRSHGESEGKTITFGVRERYDCLAWAQYAAHRFGAETPIFLWGISMGGATVLMAADLELPKSVRGIAADCGFDSPAEILKDTIRGWHWPMFPTYSLARLGARLFGKFGVTETSALECVRKARVPILLVHGEADHVVPCEMVHRLEKSCRTPVTVLTVPGADHGISWYAAPTEYRRTLFRFIEENLPERAAENL